MTIMRSNCIFYSADVEFIENGVFVNKSMPYKMFLWGFPYKGETASYDTMEAITHFLFAFALASKRNLKILMLNISNFSNKLGSPVPILEFYIVIKYFFLIFFCFYCSLVYFFFFFI